MAYTVLARKYRPQTFGDLVGQEHVTRTLSNAILAERVAHAFLFTGVRGVGKTTTARILAKALNCEKGPTPEPCGVCDICRDITAGRDTDVQEMDGASNNSVEDVRRLQESLPYRPSRARFKVVIVDEVHMLSIGAFNAFLKTLEEPPPHVKFIFATTESHKVPVTIRSRCQRYDFRLIPQTVVARRVREILSEEKIGADEDAVGIVAREAAGSMRDALTLLDQIVAFGGESLAGGEVARVLGIAEREVVHAIAAAVLEGDGASVLREVDRLAESGLDMLHFAKQLLDLVRDMVVLQVAGADSDLVALVDEERRRALDVGGSVDVQELQRAFSALSKVVDDVAQSGTPRTTLEMGLVRLATRPALLPLAELIARLDALERRGGGGGGGARRGGGGGSARGGALGARTSGAQADDHQADDHRADDHRADDHRADDHRADGNRADGNRADSEQADDEQAEGARADGAAPSPEPGATPSTGRRPSAPPKPAPAEAPTARTDEDRTDEDRTDEERSALASPPTRSATPSSTARSTEEATRGPEEAGPRAPAARVEPGPAEPAHAPPPAAAARPAEARREATAASAPTPRVEPQTPPVARVEPSVPAPPGASTPSEPASCPASTPIDSDRAWEQIVARVMDRKPALGAVLQHAAALSVSAERILLAFPPRSFFSRQAKALEGPDAIAAAAEAILGARPMVEVTTAEGEMGPTLVDLAHDRRAARHEATRERALSHPLVLAAQRVFEVGPERMSVRIEHE